MKPISSVFRFLFVLLLAAGCGSNEDATPSSVVLISIDTLRADALGCYGYERDTSPVLDAFAKESVRFDQAIVQSTATPSSHAAMLTGINPTLLKFGARFPQNELDLDPENASYGFGLIDDLTPTIQSRLRAAGFKTAGFTAHDAWLGRKNGFHNGFDHFETGYPTAPQNLKWIESWLEKEQSRPLFLFIHFYDVHSDFQDLPYRVPEPFFGKFSAGYAGRFSGLGQDDLKASTLLQSMFKSDERFEADEIRYIRDLYDEGVCYMDHHIGLLFDLLKKHGLYEDALVIVTSDHGEEFQEHGGLLHYQYYDEILRVPLLIRFPGGRFGDLVLTPQVRCVDIGPTVLDWTRLRPLKMSQGDSLLPMVRSVAEAGMFNGSVDASFSFDGWKAAYRTDRYKYYSRLKMESMLFDLQEDPNEMYDICNEQPEIAGQLQEEMKILFEQGYEQGEKLADKRSQAGRATKEFSQEALERLEELGYTGN